MNAIEFHDTLSASERREIERAVSEGREGQVEAGQAVGEEDEGGVRADEMDDGGGEGGVGGDERIGLEGGRALEVGGADLEMVDGVEVVVMEQDEATSIVVQSRPTGGEWVQYACISLCQAAGSSNRY